LLGDFRFSGVSTVTGEGLAAALTAVAAVVDVYGIPASLA
jgi:hypothetical protein